jgi:hypothetical protein
MKRLFSKEEVWVISPIMIKRLIKIIDTSLLSNYLPKHGIYITMSVHYNNIINLIDVVADSAAYVQDNQIIQLGQIRFSKEVMLISLDDFLVSNEEISITPKEAIERIHDPIDRLVTTLIAMDSSSARYSYYIRTLNRVFSDIVAFYDAIIKISKLK